MKLLSRFIWLIAAILAIVFAIVALFQVRADKEFELIKNSIKAEYDVQVDNMLKPDRYSSGITSFMTTLSNDAATALFLSEPVPDPYYIDIYLHNDILRWENVDAIWFIKADNTLFQFKAVDGISQNAMPIPLPEISGVLATPGIKSFYSMHDNQPIWYHAAKIREGSFTAGYLVMASKLDNRWIDRYKANINNSVINIVKSHDKLPEISNQTIRITRDLNDHNNKAAAVLNIELHLPFLTLWSQTNTIDNWLMVGSIVIIILFIILFILFWVISPLKRISASLQKETSDDIQPLTKSSTELGEVARMISDYHKKTEELEASESVKRHIFEQAQVGIIIENAGSGIINTGNPYAYKLFGTQEDAILGNASSVYLETLKNVSDSTDAFESFLINSTGIQTPILRTATKMMMDGSPVVLNTFVDLSEIKSLQDKLQEEKKKLSLAVQNSGLAFCEYSFSTDEINVDKNWKFIAAGTENKNWKNLLGNIHESDKTIISSKFESLIKGAKDALAAEFRIKHPDRGFIWINLSVLITRRNENGMPLQLIGLINDVTERVIVQQELIKAKEKAEESDRMKSSYIGNMSHKIRTPLNTIVGFANLLSEEDLDTTQKDNFIGIIRKDTEQVLHLIDDMINIAKIDANQLEMDVKACNVNPIINNLAEYYRTNDKTRHISFNVNTMLPDGKDVIKTDALQLKTALNNLINNAFKFTEKGEIEIGYFVNPADKKMVLYVKDSGIGIDKNSKDKIFNRFYQANPHSEGTGLGLTITKSIVNLLGGRITFESEIDKGSKFYIELPID